MTLFDLRFSLFHFILLLFLVGCLLFHFHFLCILNLYIQTKARRPLLFPVSDLDFDFSCRFYGLFPAACLRYCVLASIALLYIGHLLLLHIYRLHIYILYLFLLRLKHFIQPKSARSIILRSPSCSTLMSFVVLIFWWRVSRDFLLIFCYVLFFIKNVNVKFNIHFTRTLFVRRQVSAEKHHVHYAFLCCLKVLQSLLQILALSHRRATLKSQLIQFLILIKPEFSIKFNSYLHKKTKYVNSYDKNSHYSNCVTSSWRLYVSFHQKVYTNHADSKDLNDTISKLSFDETLVELCNFLLIFADRVK